MGRRIIITDIHGCFYSFKELLEEQLNFRRSDSLYLLGDYINKGPFSKKVLDYLIQLRQDNFNLQLLRGNHEQELLNFLEGKSPLDSFISKGGQTFLNNFDVADPLQIPSRYVDFIRELKYFIELPDLYLVHAGFDFSRQNPFTESEDLLNIRDYSVDPDKTGGRPVIHGHSPTDLDQILQTLKNKESLHYSLDAGCAYKNNPKQAHLLALDADSWEVFYQPNIDHSGNYS